MFRAERPKTYCLISLSFALFANVMKLIVGRLQNKTLCIAMS